VTFADGVLRLVRVGVRIDRDDDPASAASSAAPHLAATAAPAFVDAAADLEEPGGSIALAAAATGAAETGVESDAEFAARLLSQEELEESAAVTEPYLQAGFSDIEAAVGLVQAGVATRVVLAGFQSWPGLLWRAYQLAEASDVLILPTVVRPGGKVDIVITRNTPADG
jgi:hypothetical protein